MKLLRRFHTVMFQLGFGVLVAASSLFANDTLPSANQLVANLDIGEPHDAMISVNNFLYVGKSRLNFNANYSIEVYDQNLNLVSTLRPTHSVTQMKRFGNSVMVTGINPNSRLTEYSVVGMQGGRATLKTTQIALGGFINSWIGQIRSNHYFTDYGGNPNDPELSLPAQTLFSARTTRATYLPTRVRLPEDSTSANGLIYLKSSEAIGSRAGQLVEVNPANGKLRKIYATKTEALEGVDVDHAQNKIYSLATDKQQAYEINLSSGELLRTYQYEGLGRSFERIGHCLVVGAQESEKVFVFDQRLASDEPVYTIEIGLPMEEFSGIRKIAVNPANGKIFVRSNFACNPLIDGCPYDYNKVLYVGDKVSEAVANTCITR